MGSSKDRENVAVLREGLEGNTPIADLQEELSDSSFVCVLKLIFKTGNTHYKKSTYKTPNVKSSVQKLCPSLGDLTLLLLFLTTMRFHYLNYWWGLLNHRARCFSSLDKHSSLHLWHAWFLNSGTGTMSLPPNTRDESKRTGSTTNQHPDSGVPQIVCLYFVLPPCIVLSEASLPRRPISCYLSPLTRKNATRTSDLNGHLDWRPHYALSSLNVVSLHSWLVLGLCFYCRLEGVLHSLNCSVTLGSLSSISCDKAIPWS